jgi:hypothetical protein
MSINHGLIGGKREAQNRYIGILSNTEYASIYTKVFTFDNFDEMQNNPYIYWEFRLTQIWMASQLNEIVAQHNIVTEKSKKYKSLHRFVGDIDEFDGLLASWNTLLDFDIENWFTIPYNTEEHYAIKQIPAWPRGTFAWGANILKTDQQLHGAWGGHEIDWYVGFSYHITANAISISATDTQEETFGHQFIIRKLGNIPYEISK